jgi:hypothetical protein
MTVNCRMTFQDALIMHFLQQSLDVGSTMSHRVKTPTVRHLVSSIQDQRLILFNNWRELVALHSILELVDI